mgnify:CR=1 FL=1
MNIQWYPGHMTKAKRQMQEDLKLIDLIIELVDARVPLSSRNPDIDQLGQNKSRLILLNKADLADERQNEAWKEYFQSKGFYVVKVDSRSGSGMKMIQNVIQEACKEKIERDRRRGIKNRPIRAMVAGIPNVGKSTFLSRVTNAKPKIANYHFTTLNPNLGVVDLGEKQGFVIADIPGIIEGASEGVGLGIEFLRHIERTKVLIHIVDAASTEGRDPIVDIEAINKELRQYNEELASRPMVIAANKCDALYGEDYETVIQLLKDEYEPKGIKVFPISAVSGKGVEELLWYVNKLVKEAPDEVIEFAPEMDVEFMDDPELPFEVTKSEEEEHVFLVEGPRIEKMLGYTNLESEKGFAFFQRFLKDNGILQMLEDLGIEEGDTVRLYGLEFDYYR